MVSGLVFPGAGGIRIVKVFDEWFNDRFEERELQNFVLAFVDARGEKVVQMIAPAMTVQERPPAVSAQDVERSFAQRIGGPGLGDDPFDLATDVALQRVSSPRGQQLALD